MLRMDPDATDQNMLPSPKKVEPVLAAPIMVTSALVLLMRIPVNPIWSLRSMVKVVPARSLSVLTKVSCEVLMGAVVVAVPALDVLQKEPL